MPDLTPTVSAVFARHLGIATAERLSRAGMSARTRQRMVRQASLEVVYRGTYRLVAVPATLESRCIALCLTYPSGFVTGPTGGKLLVVRRMPPPEPIHFSVPHGLHVEIGDGVVLRQSTSIRPMDVMTRSSGLRLASWPRLAFDIARDVDEFDHASIVEQLLADGRCTFPTLVAIGRRLVHSGRAGSYEFSRTLLHRAGGGPLESHPEVIVARLLADRGIPIVAQLRDLVLPNGAKIRVDLTVPEARWAVEVDVHPDHLLLDGTTRDKRRDRQLHRIGWQVERVTPLDLLDLEAIGGELEALYVQRLRDLGLPDMRVPSPHRSVVATATGAAALG